MWRPVAFFLVLLIIPSAVAKPSFPLDFEVDNHGSVDLAGHLDAQAKLSAILHDSRDGAGEIRLAVDNARIAVVRHMTATVRGDPYANITYPLDEADRAQEDFRFSGEIRVAVQGAETVVLLPRQDRSTIDMAIGATPLTLHEATDGEPGNFWPTFEGRLLSAWRYAASIQVADAQQAQGSVLLLVYGPDVVLNNGERTISTGLRPTAGAAPTPTTEVSQDDQVYAVVYADDATVDVTGSSWRFHVQSIQGHLFGQASLTDASEFSGTPQWQPGAASLLQVEGAFDVAGSYGDGGQQWTVRGEGTYLGVDGNTVQGTKGLPWQVVAATTGGLGLFGLLLWLLKRLGAAIGYNTTEPLKNHNRLRLLLLVMNTSGVVTSAQAVKVLGIRRWSLMHHARMLANHGYLTMARAGTQWHFAPVAAVRPDAALPPPPQVIACLGHPIRKAIFQIVGETDAPLSQAEIVKALQTRGQETRFNLLAYHLSLLLEIKLIEARQGGRRRCFGVPPEAKVWLASRNASNAWPSEVRQAFDGLVARGLASRLDSGRYTFNSAAGEAQG